MFIMEESFEKLNLNYQDETKIFKVDDVNLNDQYETKIFKCEDVNLKFQDETETLKDNVVNNDKGLITKMQHHLHLSTPKTLLV